MASGGSDDYDITCMESNIHIFDRVVDDLTTAARLLDEKRDRVRSIKYTAGIAAGAGTVLGAAGFLFTGGLSGAAAAGAVASVAVGAIILLAQIVEYILKRNEFDGVERRWDELKNDVARRRNIPRQNKDRIADWARHELSSSSANAVIAAIEKSISGSQTTDRMKALSSTDINELLNSLLCIVATDFTIFETFVGSLNARDEPGDAIRNLVKQVKKNREHLQNELETARREERERREREERERREREKRERKERERRERERREREECAMFVMELQLPPPDAADASSESAKPDNPQDPRHLDTSRSTEPLLDYFQKVSVTSELNLLTSYSAERGVQTTDPVVHAGFPPAFCSEWELIGHFDQAGGILRKAKSDVILKVPPDAIPRDSLNVDVYMSVCVDIDRIQKSLNLPESDFVASPLVEFWAGEDFQFQRPVQITLPHCLHPDADPDEVVVYRATKNINGETVLNKLNPQESKPSNLEGTKRIKRGHEKNEATYYVSEDRKLFIQTDCFSGLLACTRCKRKNKGCQTLMLAGSGTNQFKDGTSRQTASVHVHIWDRRYTIRDYFESIPNRVTDLKQLPLFEENLRSYHTLSVRLDVTAENVSSWRHCMMEDGQPGHPIEQKLKLQRVLGCDAKMCCANTQSETVDWVLETVEPSYAGHWLQCVVLVTHVPREDFTRLAIELKTPRGSGGMLKRENLELLDFEELKAQARELGVSNRTIDSLCSRCDNEDDARKALIEYLNDKCGPGTNPWRGLASFWSLPSPAWSSTRLLDVENRSLISSSASDASSVYEDASEN